uniref:Uncharacterized protein n=1 Tax=Geospiza parvula TaxID=87175 RepID=A0A8U8BNW7_GEOPR
MAAPLALGGPGSLRPDPVETLQEEAICAICLDYFADPVSIGCGHNFCRGCISRLWARGGAGCTWEGPAAFTCPQCRKSFSQRSFRPNLQLANMVHIIRQLQPGPAAGPAPGGPPELCPAHREPLKLFCEQDLAPICVVCREARGHRQHSVLPLDEALQESPPRCPQEQMQAEVQELEADFEELQRFLAGEQLLLLRQLQERHQALQARQIGVKRLEIGIGDWGLKGLEIGVKRVGIRNWKLGVKGRKIWKLKGWKFGEKSGNWRLKEWKFSVQGLEIFLQTPTPNPLPTPAADVTLDPSTAHPRLSLSLDRRSVRLSERRAEPADGARQPRPDGGTGSGDLCVLGSPGFTGGRHYWEVEVGGRRGWAVGAARASARGRPQSAQSGPAAPPKREIWALGTSGKKYQALTATEQTALVPAEQPRRFGVYLDYDRGQLCFYNAESMSHIHTFHICCCRQRVFPFFRVLARGTRIKICT